MCMVLSKKDTKEILFFKIANPRIPIGGSAAVTQDALKHHAANELLLSAAFLGFEF